MLGRVNSILLIKFCLTSSCLFRAEGGSPTTATRSGGWLLAWGHKLLPSQVNAKPMCREDQRKTHFSYSGLVFYLSHALIKEETETATWFGWPFATIEIWATKRKLSVIRVTDGNYSEMWCMFEIITPCFCILQAHKKLNSSDELFFTKYLLSLVSTMSAACEARIWTLTKEKCFRMKLLFNPAFK